MSRAVPRYIHPRLFVVQFAVVTICVIRDAPHKDLHNDTREGPCTATPPPPLPPPVRRATIATETPSTNRRSFDDLGERRSSPSLSVPTTITTTRPSTRARDRGGRRRRTSTMRCRRRRPEHQPGCDINQAATRNPLATRAARPRAPQLHTTTHAPQTRGEHGAPPSPALRPPPSSLSLAVRPPPRAARTRAREDKKSTTAAAAAAENARRATTARGREGA